METTTISRRYKIWIALATVHLILVALGASHSFPSGPNLILSTIGYYGRFSGADSGYGFFAPAVGTSLSATFEITDATGKTRIEPVDRGSSREATLRINNIIGQIWRTDDKKVHRSLAASWAGKAFARYPDAEKVAVRLETYYLPSTEEYKAGKRPAWMPYYEAKFVHKSKSKGKS